MKIALVGVGKMGGAILEGIVENALYPLEEIGIYEVNSARALELHERLGVKILDDTTIHQVERVVIAVKPQHFKQLAPLIAGRSSCYISIMAGVAAKTIAESVASRRVIRVMPNLGARVGLSSTALSHLPEATEEDVAVATQLFESIGSVHPMKENLIDAFTGLSGSGPAFAAVFAEALADGGVRCGFSRSVAQDLARQVLLASAELLKESKPADLKDEVSSAGGTSITGVRALEQHGMRFAVMQAVEAASTRAKELSNS